MKKGINPPTYTILGLVLWLGACSHQPAKELPIETAAGATPMVNTETAVAITPDEIQAGQVDSATSVGGQGQIVELGTDRFIRQPSELGRQPISGSGSGGGDITLNFRDTDIKEVIKVVLSDILTENYVIDSNVSGKVTIDTSNPLTREELLLLFEEILSMNGAALVRSAGIYRILPRDQAPGGRLAPSEADNNLPGGLGARIISLRYISAQEMQKVLEPFVAEAGQLSIDTKRNLIIASGTQQQLAVIQETIDIFDVDWLRGMSIGLYPLEYVEPKTMKTELDAIFGAIEGEGSGDLLGGMLRAVPMERLNAILLISSTANALREVQVWIERLDRPGDHAGKQLFVYSVQNAKVTELGDTLSRIFRSPSGASPTLATSSELAPGLSPVEIVGGLAQGPARNIPDAQLTQGPRRGAGVSLPAGDTIEIIADEGRNALLVLATPQDYKMVELAIRKLDIVPLQVLIEATIIEVVLQDDLNYGVEWFFKNSLGDSSGLRGRGVLDLGAPGLNPLTGFSYSILDNADQVRVAINALEDVSEVHVLSAPSLMVLNNQTAFINVGDEIPIPSRQSTSNLDPNSPTVNEVQYRPTGISLTVTPRANSSGLVTMEIKQEVSNAIRTSTSGIDAPTVQQRQIESVVAIYSGETILLGGLIQDNETQSETGVPGLIKLPLLGRLFGTTRNEKRRTELLILLMPTIVHDGDAARRITDEFRRKLKSLDQQQLNDIATKVEARDEAGN